MLAVKIRDPDEITARATLRRATHATHQRMHGLTPFAQIAAGTLSSPEYRLLLQSLFVFHSAVGQAAHRGGYLLLSSARQRLESLRADLAFLGAHVPGPCPPLDVGSCPAVLGALYAAEGSMLGGRVIASQLDFAFGSNREGRSFFIGDPTDRENWLRLIAVIEAECDAARKLERAVSGAIQTFDWFEHCVTRDSTTGALVRSDMPGAFKPIQNHKH